MPRDPERRADAAGVLDFFDIPTGSAFDVAPERAIAFFRAKGLKPTFSYADMLGEAHEHAFTVAKMMDVDLLGQLRASLDSAMANGTPFREWADSIMPILQASGWWGRKEVVDPLTGKVVVAQLGSPSRLETIFRTNMQTAYAAGQWQEIEAQKDIAPYLMYDAVDDFRTRPLHASWDRTVLKVDHPWWRTHYPPNGWNCRCGVIQLSADDLEALGIKPDVEAPNDGEYTWTNPRTGEKHKVPNGVDPGFDYHVGKSYLDELKKLAAEKAAKMAARMQAALAQAKAEVEAASLKARENAIALQARANAVADAALERAKAIAEHKAKEAAAAAKVKLIAEGTPAEIGTGAGYLKKAHAYLSKQPGWADKSASEQLAAIEAKAAADKLKTETASKLSQYKKAVLEGKIPAPSMVKALQSLPAAEQQAFLAKVDAEKAAIEAKKKAEAEAAAKKAKAVAAAKKAAAQAAAQAEAQAAAAAQPAGAIPPAGTPPNPASLTQIGRKTKGATPGGLYQDTQTGQRWLLKFPDSEDMVRNEVLASKLYELAGIEVPELHAIKFDGRWALASRIIDDIQEVGAAQLRETASVLEGFAADAWLANWDSIGLNFDNVVLRGGRAIRIDVGGSLRYRATGGLKGTAWGDEVLEIDSMRNTATAPQAARVFGAMTQAQLEASVARVLRISDEDIRATVERYGPLDARERAALADRLIARKRYLAQRFPGAVERPEPPAPVRGAGAIVTDDEMRAITDSRVNGYGLHIDGPDIEDHMVVFNHWRANGEHRTRAWMKLRGDAAEKLAAAVKKTASEGRGVIQLAKWRDAALEAIKGINKRASDGANYLTKDGQRLETAISAGEEARRALVAAIERADEASVGPLREQLTIVDEWLPKLRAALDHYAPDRKAKKIEGIFGGVQNEVPYSLRGAKKKAAPSIKWQRVEGMSVEQMDIDRGHATWNGETVRVPNVKHFYEAKLADGTRIRFVPEKGNARAMQNALYIDAPGNDRAAVERAFSVLKELGIETRRATEHDRKVLYLNQFAALRLAADRVKLKKFLDLDAEMGGEELIREKLKRLRAETGIDIEQSRGWKEVIGRRQAFGHGRAYTIRPDLDGTEFDEFERDYHVYHNPNGLDMEGNGLGAAEHLMRIINGGGIAASKADRIRRGVFTGQGTSVAADFESGGADYFFTRIKHRSRTRGPGFYWKPRVLKRMDAISYRNDEFGNTKENVLERRRGQTVGDMMQIAKSSTNETVFKGGLSVFDDLDFVITHSADEKRRLIDALRAAGYSRWPDGRELGAVIKAQGEV